MKKLIAGLLIVSMLCAKAADDADETGDVLCPLVKIDLFNGKDLSGWKQVLAADGSGDMPATWTVTNGLIRCTGQPFGYLMTKRSYSCFKLHVEYRWCGEAKELNSGIFVFKNGPDNYFLPKAVETQLKKGNAGDFVLLSQATMNGLENPKNKRIEKMAPSSEKPDGEWNSVDISVKDNTIESTVNGVLQNKGVNAYTNSGNICLQSEGGPIEFRNITIEPCHD